MAWDVGSWLKQQLGIGEEDPNKALAQNPASPPAPALPQQIPQQGAQSAPSMPQKITQNTPSPVGPDNVDTIGAHGDTDTAPPPSPAQKSSTSTETSTKQTVSGTIPKDTGDKSKLLPIMLRLVLPAIAGAAIGGRGQIGALAGGLGGLAAGGAGYMKDQEAADKNASAADRFSVTTGQKNRALDISDYRSKHPGRGGRGGSNSDDLKPTNQEQPLETIARSTGGKPVNLNDPKDIDSFVQRLTSLPATSMTKEEREALTKAEPNWFAKTFQNKQAEYPDPEKAKTIAATYNDLLKNSPKTKGMFIGNSGGVERQKSAPPPATDTKRPRPNYTVE